MKKQKKTSLFILSILLISNLPPISKFFAENYHYQNADASFTYTEMPNKKLDFQTGQLRFQAFKSTYPDNPNNNLIPHL